ncbi:MAG: LysM peptidoglycan-binding domain-containing protein [Alphaproteobacteria bacterium]|nr:LysM peptidoglycan-binding domain-containing protein [Alphaproteobacteria bacterium]
MLGKTKVGPSGDWVIVPDAPIAPGGAEITLGETGKQGVAAESFVVAINEDKTSEPLVVASTPGAISEVLQGLKPTAETKLAAADPAIPAALAQPATAPTPAVAPAALAQPAPAADPAVPTAPAVPAATEATVPPPATPPEPQPEPSVAVAAPAAVAPAETSPAPAAPPAAPVAAPAAPSLAAVAPAPAATPAAPAKPVMTMAPPTIDAVEVEGDRAFFAGAGPDGATVRLYVDDVFIADATVADGRWLVEAGKVLTKPTQRVRVDLLEAGSANVASRAEVDFRIDLPAAPAETTVAAAEPAAPAAPDAAAAPATTAPAAPAAETAQAAQPLPAEPAPMAAAPAEAVPTLVAVSVGKLDDQRFSAGKAIIRRGDNLWTIARRVYGEGIKFTTIYEANTGQIRDPDRIYPGQVFNLPDGTTN